MRRWILLVLLALVAGCEDYVYELELRPQGERIERRLSLSGAAAKKVPQHIGSLYGQDANDNVFIGIFGDTLPKDVGRGGGYSCLTTRLGNAMFYAEQFFGEADPAESIARMQAGANQLTDGIIGWLEVELGQEPGFAKLRTFCDTQLRKDIMSLALTLRTFQIADRHSKEDLGAEFVVRLFMFLLERDYLNIDDAISFLPGTDDEYAPFRIVQRIVAEKMGLTADSTLPASFAFLETSKQIEQSVENYLRQTDAYQQAWDKARQKDPNAPGPEVSKIFEALVYETVFPLRMNILGGSNKLLVRLYSEVEPMETNGQWDEPNGVVLWSAGGLTPDGEVMPVICYAWWAKPDEEFQKKHFGKVALRGEELGKYCFWHENLSGKDTKEWNAFLDSLGPTEKLSEQIGKFRFSDESEGKTRAGAAVKLISKGIQVAEE